MSKEKACKNCGLIYVGAFCPNCENKEVTERFKGKVEIIDPENSEIAQKLKKNKKGIYAIKV